MMERDESGHIYLILGGQHKADNLMRMTDGTVDTSILSKKEFQIDY